MIDEIAQLTVGGTAPEQVVLGAMGIHCASHGEQAGKQPHSLMAFPSGPASRFLPGFPAPTSMVDRLQAVE